MPDDGPLAPLLSTQLPTQGESVVAGIEPDYIGRQLQEILQPPSDVDYMAVSLRRRPGQACPPRPGLTALVSRRGCRSF